MKEIKMALWECNVCMYVYDVAIGDSENGVTPGTSFEELSEDWVCPNCGNEKVNFELLAE
jgi:rubredoxin